MRRCAEFFGDEIRATWCNDHLCWRDDDPDVFAGLEHWPGEGRHYCEDWND
jgi:hypothetical protein